MQKRKPESSEKLQNGKTKAALSQYLTTAT
jgi:hypothetical protein